MSNIDYKFKFLKIGNLSQIDINSSIHYNYKGINFYYKKHNTSKRLVVSFHGANSSIKGPIFRGYDWEFNMLCISDKLLEDTKGARIAWFLSPKTKNYYETYIEIISYFNNSYPNILFTGSSGGTFPSLVFGSYFQKKVLALNGQIYLEKHRRFQEMLTLTGLRKDDLVDFDIEKIILKSLPLHTFVYQNKMDEQHYEHHSKIFEQFVNDNGFKNIFTFTYFSSSVPDKKAHLVRFPNTDLSNIVNNTRLIKKIFADKLFN